MLFPSGLKRCQKFRSLFFGTHQPCGFKCSALFNKNSYSQTSTEGSTTRNLSTEDLGSSQPYKSPKKAWLERRKKEIKFGVFTSPDENIDTKQKDFDPFQIKLQPKPYDIKTSVRVGLVGYKQGMITYFDMKSGARYPCTIVWFDRNEVLWSHSSGYPQSWFKYVEVGCGQKPNPKSIRPSERAYFKRCGVAIKRNKKTFKVSKDAVLPPATPLYASHFVPGQLVDVQALSIGKGFQGVMKRWGFKGFPASHGTSLVHRHGGSIGSRTNPGKVWKGKKMPGRMGGKLVTTLRLLVLKIDTKYNCIFLKGAVPGSENGVVRVKDSKQNKYFNLVPPPFPTRILTKDQAPLPRELVPDELYYQQFNVDNNANKGKEIIIDG